MFLDFIFSSKRYISEMFSWIPMNKDDKRLYWFTAGLCGRKYISLNISLIFAHVQ